ncbi:MAG: cytochrome P450, partial [Pseudomonas sp.]
PAHTRLRLLIRQGFTPRRLAALEPVIREVANNLVDTFAADGQVDLISQFAYPLPLTVILGMLGVPAHDMPTMRRWTQESIALNFASATLPLEQQVAYAQGKLAFQRYTRDLVTERAQAPREDLISHLLRARQEGIPPLSTEEVSSLIPGLIIAGHESTAKLIGNTMRLLLTHPEQRQALQRDPNLTAAAVEEGLRIDAPVLGMVRTTTREVTVGGVALAAGARLFLLYGSANHDETYFTDAEQFHPDRARRTSHLAFGHGIHFCLGAPLARLEARIAIETLGRRLPGLRLAPEQSFAHVPSLVFRGLACLGLVWDACP